MFTLYPAQQEIVDRALLPSSEGALALAAGLSAGKTAISLAILKAKNAKVSLVIAPNQTLGNLAKDGEADGWLGAHQMQEVEVPFKRIDSSKAGQKNFADFQWSVPGVYWTSHEFFTLHAYDLVPLTLKDGTPRLDPKGKPLVKHVHNTMWSNTELDMVIFDEVHRAQSHTSWTFRALMKLRVKDWREGGFKIGASGTFTGNGFSGAYAITTWLWPHLALKNFYDFAARWCQTVYDPFAVRNIRVVGEREPGAFFGQVPCYGMIEAEIDVEVVRKKILVDLPPVQRKAYDSMEERMVSWLHDSPMVAKVPMVKRIRMRQMTLALPSVTFDDAMEAEVTFADDAPSIKIDTLLSLLSEEIKDETVLIYTDSQKFARLLTQRLSGAGFSARERSGKITQKQREIDKQDFLNGGYKCMVGVIKAVGTGTNMLQRACRNIVFMSLDESRIENEQAVGRLVRVGQPEKIVRVWDILARDTLDMGIMSSQMQKALAHNKTLRKKARK